MRFVGEPSGAKQKPRVLLCPSYCVACVDTPYKMQLLLVRQSGDGVWRTPMLVVGRTGTVSATRGGTGDTVTFTSTATSIRSVSGAAVIGVGTGSCIMAANQMGTCDFNVAASQTQSFGGRRTTGYS